MIGKVYKKRPADRDDIIVDVLAVVAKLACSFFAIIATAYAVAGMVTQ